MTRRFLVTLGLLAGLFLAGCATQQPRDFSAMAPKATGPVKEFASGDAATQLLQGWKGKGSMLAGVPQCAGGGSDCADEYGAALMTFNTVR